jgi:type IV pilus assembly protein PilV
MKYRPGTSSVLSRSSKTSIGKARAQAGVGLIEVMIAVLVISIGFLGIAALQAVSLSTNNSALARSLATVDSYSILDIMRADLSNGMNGSYNGTVKASSCPAAGSSLSTIQLNKWCAQLGQDLGNSATGKINCTNTGSNTGNCTITITFDDSRAGVGGTSAQQVITQGML